MKIKILRKEGLVLPVEAHPSDTGFDLTAIGEPKIVGIEVSKGLYSCIDYIEYDTGIQISPEDLYYDGPNYGYTTVYPRSSISKYNLLLCNSVGIIDHSYRNSIKLRFKYIVQASDLEFFSENGILCSVRQDKIYQKGDKIAQLVPIYKLDIEWELVDKLEETERNLGGFGSSDEKIKKFENERICLDGIAQEDI